MTIAAVLDQRPRGEVIVVPPPPLPVFDWEDVVYAMGTDWLLPDEIGIASRNGANRADSDVVVIPNSGTGLRIRTDIKPAHLPCSLENVAQLNNWYYLSDGSLFLTGEFTFEGWIYTTPERSQDVSRIINKGIDAQNSTEFSFLFGLSGTNIGGFSPGRRLFFRWSSDGNIDNANMIASNQLPADTWVYASLTKDSDGWLRLFVDGVMVAKQQQLNPFYSTTHWLLICSNRASTTGGSLGGGGYFADIRFLKKAIYTSDDGHLVPTEPHVLGKNGLGDPHWNNVRYLIRFEEDDGGTGPQHFASSGRSGSSFGSTSSGHPRILATDVMLGKAALFRDTGTNTLNITSPSIDLGGMVEFTAECYIMRTGTLTGSRGIMGVYRTTGNQRQWAIMFLDNVLRATVSLDGVNFAILLAPAIFPINQRIHVALTRASNGTFRLHQNGVVVATSNELGSGPFQSVTAPFDLMNNNNLGLNQMVGWLDEIRITHNVARYGSSSFTPPTNKFPAYGYVAPPPLEDIVLDWDKVLYAMGADWEPLMPNGVDVCTVSGQNRSDFEGGGLYFISTLRTNPTIKPTHLPCSIENVYGSTSYSLFQGLDNELVTGMANGDEFTFEGWIYTSPHEITRVCDFIRCGDTVSNTTTFSYSFGLTGSNINHFSPVRRIMFAWSVNGTNINLLASEQLLADTWVYASVCRDSEGWVRLFVNGIMVGKVHAPTFFLTNMRPQVFSVRSGDFGNSLGGGYFADVRFTKQALYISDDGHPVPTEALPMGKANTGDVHWNNTRILIKFEDGYDDANAKTIASSGKFGPWLENVGTSNQPIVLSTDLMLGKNALRKSGSATVPTWPSAVFSLIGLVEFTIEFYFMRTANRSDRCGILGMYRTTNNQRQWSITLNDNKLECLVSLDGTFNADVTAINMVASSIFPINQRIHVALTRSSNGVVRLWQDGVVVASSNALGDTPFAAGVTPPVDVFNYNNVWQLAAFGWLDEVRVTHGVDRYGSSSFTPGHVSFPAYEYTAPVVTVAAPMFAPTSDEEMPDDGNIVDMDNEDDDTEFVLPDTIELPEGYTIVVRRRINYKIKFRWLGFTREYLIGFRSFTLTWTNGAWVLDGRFLVAEWEADVAIALTAVRIYEDIAYRCIEAHTTAVGLEPPNAPTLWEQVS